MSMRNLIFLFFIILAACSPKKKEDPFAGIQNEKVRVVLERAIEKAGGWERWSSIQTIDYTKHSTLYYEDSTIESDVIQRHSYVMQPSFSARITWENEGEKHEIVHNDSVTFKLLNGNPTDEEEQKLFESVMSSLYVLCMPFKLLDEGTYLTYEGTLNFRDENADVIRAAYSPETFDNHSTSDLWYYYFDTQTGDFLGCMVYHPPTYALIHNLAFYEDQPIKLHAHRKSYRSDSARTIRFLRAEFHYSDYQVTQVNE